MSDSTRESTGSACQRIGEARKQIRIAAEKLDEETARRLGQLDRQLGDVKREMREAQR